MVSIEIRPKHCLYHLRATFPVVIEAVMKTACLHEPLSLAWHRAAVPARQWVPIAAGGGTKASGARLWAHVAPSLARDGTVWPGPRQPRPLN